MLIIILFSIKLSSCETNKTLLLPFNESSINQQQWDNLILSPPLFNQNMRLDVPQMPSSQGETNPAYYKLLSNDPELLKTNSFSYDQSSGINQENTQFFPQTPQANFNRNPQFEQNLKEEVVYVPTPVNQEYFNLLKQQQNKKVISEPRFLQKFNIPQPAAIVDEQHIDTFMQHANSNNTIQAQAFSDVINSMGKGDDGSKIEKLIELQEKDYDSYFKQLNQMEYQKIYSSLNKNDMGNVYNQMIGMENQIDYSKYLSSGNGANFMNGFNMTQTTKPDIVIDLPNDKQQALDLFSGLYNQS